MQYQSFVFVDEQLALIEMKQRALRFKPLGVEFGATDFVRVANALGGFGVFAHSERDVENQVKLALSRDTYTLIACPIKKNAYYDKI